MSPGNSRIMSAIAKLTNKLVDLGKASMARKEWDGALVDFNLALKMTNSPVQMGRMRDEAFYSLILYFGTAAEMAGEWGYAYTTTSRQKNYGQR